MSRDLQPTPGAPWYRQFWPWFLVALPATSVVGCVTVLVIALRGADTLVADDWYERGENINAELALIDAAAEAGIRAHVVAASDGAMRVELAADGDRFPPELVVGLRHATVADRDRRLVLRHRGEGVYSARGEGPVEGRWAMSIEPMAGLWRLTSRVWLPTDGLTVVPRKQHAAGGA